jgi:hypothetical protein
MTMITRSLKTGLVGFTALALGVLANATAFAQGAPGGVPTTTNGQSPPPGTLPPTFGGGAHWGEPQPNPDGSSEQPFIHVNPDGTEEIVSWAHIPPPPPPPPPPEGFADPNVVKISISANGEIISYHYKDGTVIGKNRDGKVVLVIPPAAQAAMPAPAPQQVGPHPGDRPVGGGMYERAGTGTTPAPGPAPQQVGPHPGDRPVGGGMYERAGTGVKLLDGFIDVPIKKVDNGPKIHLGDEPPQIGMAIPHVQDHAGKNSSLPVPAYKVNSVALLGASKVESVAAKKLQLEAPVLSKATALKLEPSKREAINLPAPKASPIAMAASKPLTTPVMARPFSASSLNTAVITTRVGAITITTR